MIYLDHNSTTPLAPEAAAAMAEWQTGKFGNPASQHGIGRRARQALEDARDEIGRILGARRDGLQPDRVIFTSGGTEANNLALAGITGCFQPRAQHSAGSGPGEIVISSIEHPSITAPAEHLERLGWTVHRLPAKASGVVDSSTLPALLNERTRLVSVMLANNETGALQPVAEIAALCRARNIPLHTDAVQVAGKLPLDSRQLDVSAMTVAAHKFHGPLGIGALLVRHEVPLQPLLLGGFQQEGYRGGTESVALAVGMRAALVAWEKEHEARRQRMFDLRARFEAQLGQAFGSRLVVIGHAAERLPHTSNVAILGVDRQALVIALDMAGVACSSGSACASGSSEPSPVLLAMNCDPAVVDSAVRFSLGANTSPAEIDGAVQKIIQVVEQMPAKRTAPEN
jgi:cysteine desulfurase